MIGLFFELVELMVKATIVLVVVTVRVSLWLVAGLVALSAQLIALTARAIDSRAGKVTTDARVGSPPAASSVGQGAPPPTPPSPTAEEGPELVAPAVGPTHSPSSAPQRSRAKPVAIKGQPAEPWSSLTHWQDIVGEAAYESAFKSLLADYGRKLVANSYDWIDLPGARASLVREPDNPYDPNAIAVWIDERRLVGYLPRDVAIQYADRLDRLARGDFLRVEANVRIGPGWDDGPAVRGSVRVLIPAPEGVEAFNDLPEEPHVVLPPGRALQVIGEEHHMDVLAKFSLGSVERHVAATLHVVTERKTERSQPVDLVEVRLDGERVGTMTKAASEQVRDLVAFVSDKGKTPVCRAIIKGTRLRADVTLYVARTVDVPERWLDAV